ncbi:hypothetical protein [Salinimicrobium xinjiangense]|uniref:hypothetical protein n=1 Tax=Salinimicrobium xinjiangense TaxID=438596 RepID=UPI0004078ED7|nr:hypothetical protein [Salinimicrobium xinjiangense]
MKKIFLALISILGFAELNAQIFTDDGRYELIGKDNPDIFKATGSPYLNENFTSGKIFFEDKAPLPVLLRYNVYNETIEVRPDPSSEEIFKVSDREKATYELDGLKMISDQFYYDDRKIWGFFIVHYEGDRFQLLEKPEIRVTRAVRTDSGYSDDKPARMKKTSSLYIRDKEKDVHEIKLKHKDVKKFFTSAEAKNYLSKNKIKDIEDLAGLMKFLEEE